MIYLENKIRNLGNFAKKGKENPITGTHFTKEHRKKLSLSNVGKHKVSEEHKKRLSLIMKGKIPSNKGIPMSKKTKGNFEKII